MSNVTDILDKVSRILHNHFRGGRGNTSAVFSAAQSELIALLHSEIQKAQNEHIEIYRWLLGFGDFPVSEPGKRYAWRTELRKRLPAHILAQLTNAKGEENE